MLPENWFCHVREHAARLSGANRQNYPICVVHLPKFEIIAGTVARLWERDALAGE
jgi:hypothetical protein